LITELWQIEKTKKLDKQITALPNTVRPTVYTLLADLETDGAHQPNWPKYSPLKKRKEIPDEAFHCHLKRGRPTYVACWRIVDKKRKIIEVYYVGTHENAPY
jgi:hypothetical protein